MMTILAQEEVAPRIFKLTLQGKLVGEMQTPGQFLHIKVPRADLLLRRPISINAIDQATETCQIIYRIEGDGTKAFSELTPGMQLDVLGPLGNGFDLSKIKANDVVYLIGGGIGVPPLYELSRRLKEIGAIPVHFFGFASQSVMYDKELFEALGVCHWATDDGSFGMKGHVGMLLDQVATETPETPAAVFACGNKGMLRTVDERYRNHPNAQLSHEARMACGMGACYGCVCHVTGNETGTKSVKVCDEGPVFPAGKVVI